MRPVHALGFLALSAMVASLASAESDSVYLGAGPGQRNSERLILDVRIFEARLTNPDLTVLDSPGFPIDTNGLDVTPRQWLATISRRLPDAFLGVLGTGNLDLTDGQSELSLKKRGREWRADFRIDAAAPGSMEFSASWSTATGEPREVARTVPAVEGKTFVWSARELELTTTEYISHFRDFEDVSERGRLFEHLRDYSIFIVVAASLRREARSTPSPVAAQIPRGAALPELESPLGIQLRGEVELSFEVRPDGLPFRARIIRSSIPEVNPRMLGALRRWRFPDLAGRTATLSLSVATTPPASR